MFHCAVKSRLAVRTGPQCSIACSRLDQHTTDRHRTIGRLPDSLQIMTDLRLPTNTIVKPDKDMFLHEENPFEAMMSRFDKAADLLDLEPGLYKVLRKPE